VADRCSLQMRHIVQGKKKTWPHVVPCSRQTHNYQHQKKGENTRGIKPWPQSHIVPHSRCTRTYPKIGGGKTEGGKKTDKKRGEQICGQYVHIVPRSRCTCMYSQKRGFRKTNEGGKDEAIDNNGVTKSWCTPIYPKKKLWTKWIGGEERRGTKAT